MDESDSLSGFGAFFLLLNTPMSEGENELLTRWVLGEAGNTGAVDRLPEFVAGDCRVRHSIT
jgi:hypothetical protein